MTTPPAPRFGALLKHYRRAAGLTQEALAEQARLSVRGIQNLESGISQTPRPDTVALLAAALGLAPEERAELLAAARRPRRPPRRALPPAPAAGGPTVASSAAEVLVPLVGRQRELALVAQFLAGAGERGRAAPLLLLAGEPGIGKTRLLQAVAQQAIAQGWGALAGGCYRHGGQEPYAPLLDALAQHLQAQTPARRRAALAGCAWLVRLLPELAEVLEPLPSGTLTPEQERRLMFGAVARLLANVAGPAGTLLVLDDLQWAGPDALDLLATLVRTPPPALREKGMGVLRIVGAYRDTEVRPGDPLGLLLADLAQAGLARHHALGPLAPQEAAALLADLLGGVGAGERAVAERVLQRAGGTPFVLVSYAQALQQGSPEAAEAVPWDVAQGVRQRVALLPQTAQELLGAAAIVGRQVPRALLVALAGQPEEAVLAGLEAACWARLLREEGEEEYAFAHDVIREVVEADVGAARRALLHRRVARALEAAPAGAPAELLAYHYARGGASEKAAQYLELAGDRAWAQRAHGAAQSHYREVLDRLEALGRTREAVRVREKLGEVLYRAGHYDAAIQVLEPAAETLRAAGDWEGLGRVTASIGRALYPRGTPQEGIARLTALLELMEQSGASASTPAALYAALAQLLFATGQYGESLATSERAAELARAGGDDRTRLLATVLASWNRANILLMRGRLGEALRLTEEALPLVEALGDLEGLLMAHRDLAYRHTLRGAVATGRGHIARALALAEQLGDPGQLALTLALRGWLALLGGDWQGARADLDQALALSRQIDRSPLSAYPLILRARLSLAAGERATATTGAQEALALAERHQDLQALRWASAVVAAVDVLEGRPAAASARLAPLLDRDGLEDCDVTALLPVLAWAHLEHGQVAQATAVVGQALRRTRPEEMRLVLVEALRVEAMIAICQKRWAAAGHSLEEGVALARSMPYPYAEARLLHVYGRLHLQKGEPEAARERLAAARALFGRLGARTDLDLTEQALTTLPGGASLHPSAALSPRHGVAAASPAGARLSRPDRHAWALDRLREDGALSPRVHARALGVSVDTALLDLRALVDRGLVRAQGTTKDRRYVLADDDRA